MNKDYKFLDRQENDHKSWSKLQRKRDRHHTKQKIREFNEDEVYDKFEPNEKFRKTH